MKTPEDEAFDDLAKRQGDWGGGFTAKRAMAADKLQEDRIKYGTSWEKDGERIDPMSVYKEPAQEPVALVIDGVLVKSALPEKYTGHLYTTPPQREWVGLTEDERDHLTGLHLYAVKGQVEAWIEGVDDFAQAIEAKLKDKNT